MSIQPNWNHLVSSRLISSRLISSHLISSHLISSHLISLHLISSHLISCHVISSQFNSAQLKSSHLVSSRLVSSHLISSISSHLIDLISSHLISSHLISSISSQLMSLISSRLVSCQFSSTEVILSRLISSHVMSSRLNSIQLNWSHLISSHLVSSRLISSHRSHLVSLISSHLVSTHLISSRTFLSLSVLHPSPSRFCCPRPTFRALSHLSTLDSRRSPFNFPDHYDGELLVAVTYQIIDEVRWDEMRRDKMRRDETTEWWVFFRQIIERTQNWGLLQATRTFKYFCLIYFHFPLIPLGDGGGGVLPYSLGGVYRWVRESPTYPLLDHNFANLWFYTRLKMPNCSWFQSFVSDPVKRDPKLDQFSMITRPFTRPNGLKTVLFPVASTRIANIWEPSPPPPSPRALVTSELLLLEVMHQ